MRKAMNEAAPVEQYGENVQETLFSFPRRLVELIAGASFITERPNIWIEYDIKIPDGP